MLRALDPAAAIARAADAVGRGNRKVYEEIGREFARFLEMFGGDGAFDAVKMARFCAALRPGEPPDGQRLLALAFTRYGQARFQSGPDKSELLLLANLCAGFHEQTRLQPEIAAALNAGLGGIETIKRDLMDALVPRGMLRSRLVALLDRRTLLDSALGRLVGAAIRLFRLVFTDRLMTLHLARGEVLRLGRDLRGAFPATLKQIGNVELEAMLARVDCTANSLVDSGARDWADLPDRMHFIADFFRLYQEQESLFDPPFSEEQAAWIRSGRRPEGRL
ncbi:MAG: hypothetical protein AB7T18_19565 [Alphaproteobacteria bacterium]